MSSSLNIKVSLDNTRRAAEAVARDKSLGDHITSWLFQQQELHHFANLLPRRRSDLREIPYRRRSLTYHAVTPRAVKVLNTQCRPSSSSCRLWPSLAAQQVSTAMRGDPLNGRARRLTTYQLNHAAPQPPLSRTPVTRPRSHRAKRSLVLSLSLPAPPTTSPLTVSERSLAA